MNKVISDKYKECYYEETLKNGLHVVIWHKENYVKSFALMATPLGAFDISQIDSKGNVYSYHSGLAHFLEHKMFEKMNHDVMEDFSSMGANVNASTTYDSTSYYFQTSSDLYEPLNLLLDFTQSLDITEQSVEKEKGIIIQELKMYEQMSDFCLIRETFEALYENHPLRFDIGGNTESVNHTTLEELEKCFKYNYHPSSMVCVIVSGEDPEKIMNIIRDNQNKKKFCCINEVHRRHFKEKREVVDKNRIFEMDINCPKVSLAFKLNGIRNSYERLKVEIALRFALDALFTPNNPDYQNWLDDEIINDYFGYDFDFGEDYGYLMVYSETNKKDFFIDLVFEQLKKLDKLSTSLFEQLKRRYYGENIKELNDFESIAFNFARYYFDKIHYFDVYDLVQTIQFDDIYSILNSLNFDNYSIIECVPLKKAN